MSKRKLSDLMEAGPSRQEDEVIVISDSEDEELEPACVDIHEVPQVGIPAVGQEEESEEQEEDEDEDPEEDSEWLAEIAHDAAILEMEEQSVEGEVPNDEEPEPGQDPVWDIPVPEPEDAPEEDAPEGDAPGEPEPVDNISIAMLISAIQQAAAEVHHAQAVAEDHIGVYQQENARLRELLKAERRRSVRLTTLVHAAQSSADSLQVRLDSVRQRCADALVDLTHRVRDHPHYPDQPYYTISRQEVQGMIQDVKEYVFRRY